MKKRRILSMGSAKLKAIHKFRLSIVAISTCCICIAIASRAAPVIAKSPDWVVRSNEFAELLENAIAAKDCQKELNASQSLLEVDPTFRSCRQQDILQTIRNLEQTLDRETDNALRIDLKVLLEVGKQTLQSYKLDDKYRLPYIDLSQAILDSLESTLDESKSVNKQQKAVLAKLEQYAGLEPGKTALTSSLKQKIKVQLQKSEVVFPNKQQLKKSLKNNASQISQIRTFLKQQNIPNYEPAYAQLKTQLFDYEAFIRGEVLTKVEQKNFRLPRELYTLKLAEQGIKTPIEEVMQQAHTAFIRVQQQMEAIAPQIAQQRGFKGSNYRQVIRSLKQEHLSAQETLDLYRERAQELETIIQREQIVTLPKDKFNIRLATVEENKNFPVPLYDGYSSTFVIPVLQNPQKAKLYNDFTNPAMSWTLTVHEGKPGHHLQLATVKNHNLSDARTNFAFNATSVEGWATYAEEIMQPYMPLAGRFMSLQLQLLRAARAFLEPELQLGKVTTADALKVLTQDAGFSRFFAQQEIKRYTKTRVGQAPTYFYGYQQFLQLRSQTEKALGEKFDPQQFHDFLLSQGYLTPKLLEQVLQSQMWQLNNI